MSLLNFLIRSSSSVPGRNKVDPPNASNEKPVEPVPGQKRKNPTPGPASNEQSVERSEADPRQKKAVRKFQEGWKKNRPWLQFSAQDQLMTCKLCIEYYGPNPPKNANLKGQNSFILGSGNLKASTVSDHEECKAHRTAQETLKAKKSTPSEVTKSKAGRALLSLKQADRSRLKLLFKNAHAVAKQGRPLSDYAWLCKIDLSKQIDLGSTYLNEKAALKFVSYIADAEKRKTVELVNRAKFFSFMMDGSTDISGDEQEAVYVRVSDKGQVTERFLAMGSTESTCAADLYEFLNGVFQSENLPKEKLLGMGSDGASNMVGKHKGLATLLRKDIGDDFINIHCLCHRLELAFRDVVKASKQYDKLMTLLIGLHYFYKKSYKNKKQLQHTFEAMDVKGTLPPKVTGTRWLSHLSNGINSLLKSFKAYEASLSTLSHTNPKAGGLAKIMCDINTLTYALFMKELLNPLMQLSQRLQRKDITLADSMDWIETTAELVEDLNSKSNVSLEEVLSTSTFDSVALKGQKPKMAYTGKTTDEISAAIKRRYDLNAESITVVNATKILCLRKWPILDRVAFADYGCAEIQHVAEYFSERLQRSCSEFSVETAVLEWDRLKKMVAKRYATQIMTVSWTDVYDEDLPQIMLVIDLLLSLPPTSVSCETCFSQMKLTKTSRRINLKPSTLNSLLQVKLVSSDIGIFDPEEAIDQWLIAAPGRRRLHYSRHKNSELSDKDQSVAGESHGDDAAATAFTQTIPEDNLNVNEYVVDDDIHAVDDEDDELEVENINNAFTNCYDDDSDYCSDFQDEYENEKNIESYLKEYL